MIKTVEVVCHTCDGSGRVIEIKFTTKENIQCICPECEGLGYVKTKECG